MDSGRRLVRDCGYNLLGDFVLPEAAWWDDYYRPMEKRLAELILKYADDPTATAVLAENREEIEIYRQFSDHYGYVFLVMAPTPDSTSDSEFA